MYKYAEDFEKNTIYVTMYLYPLIYVDSNSVFGAVRKDNKGTYRTDVNPSRLINGPLSEYGKELEPPIRSEYEEFMKDCLWLVEESGFKVIKNTLSTDSKKSRYVIVFGVGDTLCGSIVYDLRISDHPFDAVFPEDLKSEVLEYLKMENVLDGEATEAGIDFEVEKVTVGSVINDTWDRAFQRLNLKLKQMRRKIRIRLNR